MANVVDTNGWDTVAAIPYRDVNAAIIANSASPPNFSQTASDGSASANGTFGQWSLTTGGAGPDLMMSLPITGGTVTVGTTSHPITACVATVLVHAAFLPQPDHPHLKALRLSAAAVGDPANTAAVQSLVPAQPNFLANAALGQLLQDWLNANLQSFNHVFAVVDLDAEFTVEGLECDEIPPQLFVRRRLHVRERVGEEHAVKRVAVLESNRRIGIVEQLVGPAHTDDERPRRVPQPQRHW